MNSDIKKFKTFAEFWSEFLQVTFHLNSPERWTFREKKAKWLIEQTGLKSPSKILDLGCGDGILDIWLSRMGHQLTSVDRVQSVLDRAEKQVRISVKAPSCFGSIAPSISERSDDGLNVSI